LENGLRLAERTGAKVDVVQLFAVFHDSRRVSEGSDVGHGKRGAEFAATLRGEYFDLPDEDFDLLFTACAEHTDGRTHDDITVQTCWDADRLDLGRVGVMVDRRFLCTAAAKDWQTMTWAEERAARRLVPEFVQAVWGFAPGLTGSARDFDCDLGAPR
jgi:uncharacterized protein